MIDGNHMKIFDENDYLDLLSIQDFIRYAYSRAEESALFYGHGTDNPWDDMRQLVLDSLSLPHDLPDNLLNCTLSRSEKDYLFQQVLLRIRQHVPVPYLTNKAYFCDLEFYVDERVLIPRSPIAESIRQQFSPWINPAKVHHILDMCTGSACIAIACCYAFSEAEVDAVDISREALEVAEINRQKHELAEQLSLYQSDCFNDLPQKNYDIIIANPPYVGDAEMQTLPREYTHEPEMALQAPDNGMEIVDRILRDAYHYLSQDGMLVMEVGNSETLVNERYPDLALTWLEFEYGGEGVFLVSSKQLQAYFESR